MRYTVICPAAVFVTDYLMFPDWNHVHAIIDNQTTCYVQRADWNNPDVKPSWKPITVDSL